MEIEESRLSSGMEIEIDVAEETQSSLHDDRFSSGCLGSMATSTREQDAHSHEPHSDSNCGIKTEPATQETAQHEHLMTCENVKAEPAVHGTFRHILCENIKVEPTALETSPNSTCENFKIELDALETSGHMPYGNIKTEPIAHETLQHSPSEYVRVEPRAHNTGFRVQWRDVAGDAVKYERLPCTGVSLQQENQPLPPCPVSHEGKVVTGCSDSESTFKPATEKEQFTRQLAKQLLDSNPRPVQQKKSGRPSTAPLDALRLSGKDVSHFLEPIPPTEKKKFPTRQCVVCTFRGGKGHAYHHRAESRFQCVQCGNKAMCIYPCHMLYHTVQDYKSAVKEKLGLHF